MVCSTGSYHPLNWFAAMRRPLDIRATESLLEPNIQLLCFQSNWSSHVMEILSDLNRTFTSKVTAPPSTPSWSTALRVIQANVCQVLSFDHLRVNCITRVLESDKLNVPLVSS